MTIDPLLKSALSVHISRAEFSRGQRKPLHIASFREHKFAQTPWVAFLTHTEVTITPRQNGRTIYYRPTEESEAH